VSGAARHRNGKKIQTELLAVRKRLPIINTLIVYCEGT
jgi:hypothetical protein